MEIKEWTPQTIGEVFPNCVSLQDLFRAIEHQAKENGFVVCRFELNGLTLTEEDEIRFAQTPLEKIEVLRVSLAEPSQLVSDTLVTLKETLQNLRSRCLRVSDLIRENPAGRAQYEFSSLMEQTKFLTDALGALKPRLKRTDEAVTIWMTAETHNRATVQELMSAFKGGDFMLVADVLEYELHNLMELWAKALDHCKFD
jgi:hypothetical protein